MLCGLCTHPVSCSFMPTYHSLAVINLAPAGSSTLRVCLCVCLSVTVLTGTAGTWRAKLRYQQKALDVTNKINIGILLKLFSLTVTTVFSSPRKLYLVLMPQNRHQLVTIAVTRVLVRQAWCLAIPTTTNQAAQSYVAIVYFDGTWLYTVGPHLNFLVLGLPGLVPRM